MPELAIIADDLTGALDAAAPFAMRGIRTSVALGPDGLAKAIAGGARVLGVSTDSREIAPHLAREAVRAAVAALPSGIKLFKKVDSRLKGNIEAELDAIPHDRSLVVPAIPAFGRWMRDGKLGGFGVAEPIDIRTRLGRHAGSATIPDITAQGDIEMASATAHDLPIGARGLAEAIARRMAPDGHAPDATLRNPRAYLVIGSTDPITLAQIDRLRKAHPDLHYIAAPNGHGRAGSGSPPLTLVQATAGAEAATGKSVAAALGSTLAGLAPASGSLLVLSGGETAQAILARLGISVLDVVGEALPGLPLCRAGGLTVVTKSGGFGGEETLERLLAPFRAHEERIALP